MAHKIKVMIAVLRNGKPDIFWAMVDNEMRKSVALAQLMQSVIGGIRVWISKG